MTRKIEPLRSGAGPRDGWRPWRGRKGFRWCVLLVALLAVYAVVAGPMPPPPRVALIIDDMGNHSDDAKALDLPGSLTYSFLPHTPHAAGQAILAHRANREVMLHLPMESVHAKRLGPGALTERMDDQALQTTLVQALAAVPYVAGINNHMGSLLTADAEAMSALMRALSAYPGLYFVDSRTTAASLAEYQAEREGLASARRDVFLDHDPDPDAIAAQFDRLVRLARRRGSAIAIAHPHPDTLALLRRRLPELAEQGIELVPVSALTEQDPRRKPWRVYSSPLPQVVKNSKP